MDNMTLCSLRYVYKSRLICVDFGGGEAQGVHCQTPWWTCVHLVLSDKLHMKLLLLRTAVCVPATLMGSRRIRQQRVTWSWSSTTLQNHVSLHGYGAFLSSAYRKDLDWDLIADTTRGSLNTNSSILSLIHFICCQIETFIRYRFNQNSWNHIVAACWAQNSHSLRGFLFIVFLLYYFLQFCLLDLVEHVIYVFYKLCVSI